MNNGRYLIIHVLCWSFPPSRGDFGGEGVGVNGWKGPGTHLKVRVAEAVLLFFEISRFGTQR